MLWIVRQKIRSFKKFKRRAGEVAQQVEVLAAKPDDCSSIPGTHAVEADN